MPDSTVVETKLTDADVAAMAKRLRPLKQERDRAQYTMGVTAGRGWAKTSATVEELERLDRYVEALDVTDRDDHFRDEAPLSQNGLGGGMLLALVLLGHMEDDTPYEGRPEKFWRDFDGSPEAPSSEYAQGFADGALEMWSAAGDKL
jgi:hypothetical protein